MSVTPSERRMVENEVVFRSYNEQVKKGFDEINKIAKEDGQHPIELNPETLLHFYCECSDENCRQRIRMSARIYTKIHKVRNNFVVLRGHEVNAIEVIITKRPTYYVVSKKVHTPTSVDSLQATDVENV